MKQYIGIIGGSGLYGMKDFKLTEQLHIDTPFGSTSAPLMAGTLCGVDCIFLARHGIGHVYSPSEVNFRANIWAMKKAGVKAIFSVSAVGSLREDIHPGDMVVVDQYWDRTRQRPSTFFEKGLVAHISMAHPVSNYLRSIFIESCQELNIKCHKTGTYVCIEGPQFSTIAESNYYRKNGADVVGMTNLQEAKLAREAEIDYATLALSTDYDCWHPDHDHVTTDQVIAVLHANIENSQKILAKAAQKFDFNKKLESEGVLANAILTQKDYIDPKVVQKLEPIIGKYF